MAVSLVDHPQHVGQTPALDVAHAAILQAIEAAGQGGGIHAAAIHRQVGLAVAVTGRVDEGVTVTGRQEGTVQVDAQWCQDAVGFGWIWDGRVFVQDGKTGPPVLADVETGQFPVVVIGLCGLDVVVGVVANADAPVVVGAAVQQHLHHPHQPHLLGGSPVGARFVEHLAVEGHAVARVGLADDVERNVDHLGCAVVGAQAAGGNAAKLFQLLIAGQVIVETTGLDLQHRDQFDVAVVVGCHAANGVGVLSIGDRLLGAEIEIGLGVIGPAVGALDLAFGVTAGPIQDVEGVPEAGLVGGAQLKLDVGRGIGGQAVDRQRQRRAAAEGGAADLEG